jgi:hypothetical protein
MKVIARHINGITINPYEYVLDNDGDVLLFNDTQECIDFLHDKTGEEMNEQEWEVNEGVYFIDEPNLNY